MPRTRTPAPPITPQQIPLQGRVGDARNLRVYARQQGTAALPLLEQVLAGGNTTMRREALQGIKGLDPKRAHRLLLGLITALAGKTTVKARNEKKLLLAMLLGLGTLPAARDFLAAGGSVDEETYPHRDHLMQALLERIPTSSAEQIQALLEQTAVRLDRLWLHSQGTVIDLTRRLLDHPDAAVSDLAALPVRGNDSQRTDPQRHEVNRLARQMLGRSSRELRAAGLSMLWTNNERVREGELQREICAIALELIEQTDPAQRSLGDRLLVRHEGLAGLDEVARRGRPLPLADALPVFLERWHESFAALPRYMEDPHGREIVCHVLCQRDSRMQLDDRWKALLWPHVDEDAVLSVLVSRRYPPAVERARSLAASDALTERTLLACELLGEIGDTASSPVVLRWLQKATTPHQVGALRQALGGCGDAAAIETLQAMRRSQRMLDTDLYMVITNIQRRLGLV